MSFIQDSLWSTYKWKMNHNKIKRLVTILMLIVKFYYFNIFLTKTSVWTVISKDWVFISWQSIWSLFTFLIHVALMVKSMCRIEINGWLLTDVKPIQIGDWGVLSMHSLGASHVPPFHLEKGLRE